MADLIRWIALLPLSKMIRQSLWLIPTLQSLHILATGMVLASIIMIDLRVWGYSRSETAIGRTRRFLPWTWVGLFLLTVTGVALIMANPRLLNDPAFQTKIVLMLVAIVATIVAAALLRPGDDAAGRTRMTASVVATLGLVLWFGVTLASRGRWMSFMFASR
jgi:uncharacterized membrane protein